MVTTDKITANADTLAREMNWFAEVLDTRMKLYFQQQGKYASAFDIALPELTGEESLYSKFATHYKLSFEERVVLALSLVPHIKPQLLDVFFTRNASYDRGFSEFGGMKGNSHGGFLPTGETALFILAGEDLDKRFSFQYLFEGDHFFAKHNILKLEPAAPNEPFLSGALTLSREFIDYFTTGNTRKPNFSIEFPAMLITTQMDWDDLVLDNQTLTQVEEIKAWTEHGDTLMKEWGLGKKLKPGYRALFYGPSGTGKTLTACLLGKLTHRDVYRIDLSMVVSKYIGETEKNLSKVFDMAENKRWILFFDEADALFGKRTKIEDSHDRYANQEVSYLLQRVEDFNGVVILSSNLKSNLDDAFTRRFQSVIHFPMPKAEERVMLWEKGFSKSSELENKINLRQTAEKYELSGGAMMNVIRYASLMALRRSSNVILLADLEEGIRKEYQKEGRTL